VPLWAARTVRQFSPEHVAALGVLVVAACLSVGMARRGRATVALSRCLAVIVLAGWVGEQVADVVEGIWSLKYTLPLQLTDVVSLTAVVALWRPRPLLVELTYFWALSASLQAVITPDLVQDFPDILYFTYFAAHSGVVAAACLLVFGAGAVPRPGAVGRVYAITAAFAGCAAIATVATGGNYMFLRRKPVHGSLLDFMGPWPVYILAGAVLALALFAALAALAGAVQRGGLSRGGA
jgi:hypothetical integral membrane protein (TIGR02206 family)